MAKMVKRHERQFRVANRVQLSAFGVEGDTGTVVKVAPGTIHTAQHVTVRWDRNGYVGRIESRKLAPA